MLTRYRLELIAAAITFVFGALAVAGSLENGTGWAADGPQAGFFPFRLGLIIMAVSALIAVISWRDRVALTREITVTHEAGRRVLGFALPVVAFVGLAQWVGLYVASAAYLAVVLIWQGGQRWPGALVIALGFSVGSYFVFERWFQVPLLKGPLETWLGIG
jgi:putative tricarboxylic transport membrane protein